MKRTFALVPVLLGLVSIANAQYKFKTFDFPESQWTAVTTINNRGEIAGSHFEDREYGFRMKGSELIRLDQTQAVWGGNEFGDMVGVYPSENGVQQGFVLQKGVFRALRFPGADNTTPISINNAGLVVGYFEIHAADGSVLATHGFTWKDGTFSDYMYPGSGNSMLFDVSDQGRIVGSWWSDTGCDNFILSAGQYTSVNVPWTDPCMQFVRKTNPQGHIVGVYLDGNWNGHGYVHVNGRFTKLDFPGAEQTYPLDINAAGQIVGWCVMPGFTIHGFLAQPLHKSKPPVR